MLAILALVACASAVPLLNPNTPAGVPALPGSAIKVQLPSGTYVGKSSIQGVNSFLSIPYAQPPIGDLRLRRALPVENSTSEFQATEFKASCHQLRAGTQFTSNGLPATVASSLSDLPGYRSALAESEDCLTVSVFSPSNVPAGGLPVLFWIYGGSYESGNGALYDGNPVVSRSIANGAPVVFVAVNYRLGGFGFLPGKVVKDAQLGNIGISDQRLGLKWVNANIAKFGGDPTKVTLWGESAGAWSISTQLLLNGGDPEGLFRAAWANSGSTIPIGKIDNDISQTVFDTVMRQIGCDSAVDALACARLVSVETFKNATTGFPPLTSFLSRADGVLLVDDPQLLVEQGKYAKIPLVSGTLTDEGTLFTAGTTAINQSDALEYIRKRWIPKIEESELQQIALAYPTDPNQGSPYHTGMLNQLTPVYKMLASFNGDLLFQAPRRFFLEFASTTQKTWSYAYDRTRETPFLGAFHASELVEFILAPGALGKFQPIDYVLNFANNLDPNVGVSKDLINWPSYSVENPVSIKFDNSLSGLIIIADTFRQAPMRLINSLFRKYPY